MAASSRRATRGYLRSLRVFDVGTGQLVRTLTDLDTIVAGVHVSQLVRVDRRRRLLC